MYRVEVPVTIKVIMATLRWLGLWEIQDQCSARGKLIKRLHLSFFASFVVSLVAGALKSEDINDSIYLTVIGLEVAIHVARLFYIIYRKSEILKFDFTLFIEDHEEFNKVNNKVRKLMQFVELIFTVAAIAVTLALSTCVVKNALPFNIAFPLDWKKSQIGYWIAFTYIAVQCTYGVSTFSLTVIIWYLKFIFAIKYELLGNQLRRMGTEIENETSAPKRKFTETEKQFMFHHDLTSAINIHRNIRGKIDQFLFAFSKLFFIQLLTSSMCICGIIYVLAFSYRQDIFMTSFYIYILSYCLFDIFSITYLGDEIKSSSDKLTYCLFESNWLEQPQSFKKFVIILGEMLRKPQELVVGMIYPVNLETFRRILNLAYNMFNILQNIN